MAKHVRNIAALAAWGLALFLSACAPSEEAEAPSRLVFNLVRAHEYAAVEAMASPNIDVGQLRATLAQLEPWIPTDEPESVSLITWSHGASVGINTASGRTLTTLHEYVYDDRILRVTTVMRKRGDDKIDLLEGFHVNILPLDGADIEPELDI